MTPYESGFLTKCAEFGLSPYFAGALLKCAQDAAGQPMSDEAAIRAGTYSGTDPDKIRRSNEWAAANEQNAALSARTEDTLKGINPTQSWQNKMDAFIAAADKASTPAQERKDMWSGLTADQRNAFRDWAKQDGQGKMFAEAFRGADGKVDQEAANQFLREHSEFLTGDNATRTRLLNERFKTLSPEQQTAFKNSDAVKNFKANYQARQEKAFDRGTQRQNNVANVMNEYAEKERMNTFMNGGTPTVATNAISGIQQHGDMTFTDPSSGQTFTAPRNEVVAAGGVAAYAAKQRGAFKQKPVTPRINPADFGGSGITPTMQASMSHKPGDPPPSSTMAFNTVESRGADSSIRGFGGTGSRPMPVRPAVASRRPAPVSRPMPVARNTATPPPVSTSGSTSFNTIESRGGSSSLRGFKGGRPGRRMSV